MYAMLERYARGGFRGGGGLGGQNHPTTPFGGPQNFIKREKMLPACTQISHVLVLNSYPDPPLFEILYPPLCALWPEKHRPLQVIFIRSPFLIRPSLVRGSPPAASNGSSTWYHSTLGILLGFYCNLGCCNVLHLW